MIGSSPAGSIDSTITLGFSTIGVPDTFAEVDSIDYAELGRTTLSSVEASIYQLSAERTAIVTHLSATGDLLTGGNQPLVAPNNVSLFGGLGSYTVGITGHFNLDGGFSLDGGGALMNEAAGGSTASGTVFAGAIRYLRQGSDTLRPFGRLGFDAGGLGMTFTRHYEDGSPSRAAAGISSPRIQPPRSLWCPDI